MADKVKIRYRGYYWDEETGFYYLQSRYYDPSLCRFISSDQYTLLPTLFQTPGQLNLYAYCNNNPIMYTDEEGAGLFSALFLSAVVGAMVGMVSYTAAEIVSYALTGKWNWSWGMFAGSIIGGAIGGMIGASSINAVFVSMISGGISTASGMLLQNAFGEANNSFDEILAMSALSCIVSGVTTGIMGALPIQGFNCGRGSLQQVARQINTKLLRSQISRITIKTFGKIVGYNLGYNCLGSVVNGFVESWQLYRQRCPRNLPKVPATFIV